MTSQGMRLPGTLLVWGLIALTSPLTAQTDDSEKPTYRYGFEIKGHYRDSDLAEFPSPLNFQPSSIPPDQDRVFLRTVEAGEHAEISVVTLWLEAHWRPWLSGKLKVDLIDRHDRNPTSEDNEWDVDELWVRFGQETEPGDLPEQPWNAYLKIGKFPKFERQDDRHLESYGLISTSFNRAEDFGFEGGVDLGRRFYIKTSLTQGNPLFYRDPNALAGDHGIEIFRPGAVINPDPDIESGFPILYDADIEDYDFSDPEFGVGLGVRLGSESGFFAGDFLVFAYGRDLAETVDLTGTFYGGDLDILRGPLNLFPPPGLEGNEKNEWGANLWLYIGDFTFFGQAVAQDTAGLRREGWEAEVSYAFDLPYFAAVGGRQLFSYVAPAFRYSEIDPQFRTHPMFPAPSIMWDWEKIDAGLRVGLLDEMVDLTLEWNDNTFVRAGRDESADEFLATVRWEMDWTR
ncbi:MAG: hypothetical protein AAF560_14520 [Acidobacteriota bacterium]